MNKRNVKTFCIVLCVLVIVGLAALTVSQYNAYREVKERWDEEQQKLVDLKNEIAQIEKSITAYKREQAEFEKLLFNERDVPAFLDEISKYAKMASMNIIDMKTQQFYQVQIPAELKEAGSTNKNLNAQMTEQEKRNELERTYTLAAMPIKIKVKGSFASFVQFLDRLQEYTQLLNIANVEIHTTREYPILDCQFTIRIYSLKTLGELQRR